MTVSFTKCPTVIIGALFLYLRLYLCGVRSKAAPEKRGNKSKQRNQQVPLLMATVLPSHARLRLRRRLTLYLPTSRPEKHPSFFNAVHFKDTSSLFFPSTTTRASLFPSATTTTSHQPVARRFRVLCACIAILKVNSHLPGYYTKCVLGG